MLLESTRRHGSWLTFLEVQRGQYTTGVMPRQASAPLLFAVLPLGVFESLRPTGHDASYPQIEVLR